MRGIPLNIAITEMFDMRDRLERLSDCQREVLNTRVADSAAVN